MSRTQCPICRRTMNGQICTHCGFDTGNDNEKLYSVACTQAQRFTNRPSRKTALAVVLMVLLISLVGVGVLTNLPIGVSYRIGKSQHTEQKPLSQEYYSLPVMDFRYKTSNDGVVITKYIGDADIAVIPAEIDGNRVTGIEFPAFYNCQSLKSITIPDSVISIGAAAFCRCKNLTSVTIPNSVTHIGNQAFQDCSSLTSVTIPDSVTSIGTNPFGGCTALQSITVDARNTAYTAKDGVVYTQDTHTLIAYPAGKSETSFSIPDSVTRIGSRAFYQCSNLNSVVLPIGVTSIGDCAFYGCSGLMSIEIPHGITRIEDWAFSSCSSLVSLIIPDNVTSIGEAAFYCCYRLTSVTVPNSVTNIGNWAFWYCDRLGDVYYTGTDTEWNTTKVGSNNSSLIKAVIHYDVS